MTRRVQQSVWRAVLGVPVFAKVMGIAFGLTVLFGVVMYGEIVRARDRIAAPPVPAEEEIHYHPME